MAATDAAAFGARGDGVADDTAALQRAIDALGPAGGTLRLAKGVYRVRDRSGSGSCLTARSGLRLIGEGAMQTVIRPETAGADALSLVPNPAWAADFTLIEGLFIGDHRTGRRVGRHGIIAMTGPKARLPHFQLRDVFVGQGSGAAFIHRNDVSGNPNGGLYAATIAGCTLHGGIVLAGSGDSIVIRENILTGEGLGIDASLVPGASLLSILDNNITSRAGAVRVGSGSRVNISRNNCEHQGASPGAVSIDLGGGRTMVGGGVKDNLLSCFSGSGFAALLRVRNVVGMAVAGNSFAAGSRGVAGVIVGEGCRDIHLEPNTWNANVSPRLDDRFKSTRGSVATDDAQTGE